MKKIIGLSFALAFLFAGSTAHAQATTTASTTVTIDQQIKALLAQIADLQAQITKLSPETANVLKFRSELQVGTSSDEVRRLQQLLATDPTIYPEGLVTGYFGPKTSLAVNRLQTKFKLDTRGYLSAETINLINGIIDTSDATSTIPSNLLLDPTLPQRVKIQITEKNGVIEYKVHVKCDSSGKGNVCKKIKSDEEDEEEDSESDDESELEIEAEIGSSQTKVKVDQDGDKERFTLNTTIKAEIIDEIASRTDLTEAEIKAVIEYEYEDEDKDEDDEDDDEEDDDNDEEEEEDSD